MPGKYGALAPRSTRNRFSPQAGAGARSWRDDRATPRAARATPGAAEGRVNTSRYPPPVGAFYGLEGQGWYPEPPP